MADNIKSRLEWIGCATGLLGAWLLSMNISYSPYGWWLFLISNIAWITFALVKNLRGLLLMQGGFMVTSLLGIYRWVIN